jgi:hypothetical protein
MSAVSSTFSSTVRYALIEERHFALVVVCAFPTWARFESSGSGTRSDPAISSITYCHQDCLIRTPSLSGSGMPNRYVGDLLHAGGDVRAFPRAKRAFAYDRSRNLGATSVTGAPPVSAPSLLSRSSVLVAGRGGRMCCATRDGCAQDLRASLPRRWGRFKGAPLLQVVQRAISDNQPY